MNELIDKIEKSGVHISAVWIQDWAGKIRTSFGKRVFWNWEWNPEQYPGESCVLICAILLHCIAVFSIPR